MNMSRKDVVRVVSDVQANSQPAAFEYELSVSCHVRHDRRNFLAASQIRLGFKLQVFTITTASIFDAEDFENGSVRE